MKHHIILRTLAIVFLCIVTMQVQAQGIYVNKKSGESIPYSKTVFDRVTPYKASSTEYGVRVYKQDGNFDYYAESELESITTFEEAFDNRITQQIPAEYLSKVSAYMPIYSGNTPPNIEGSYLLNPLTVVYDETGHYHVGKVISDMFIRFSGQNMTQNTLSYDMKQGNSTGNSDKVVILGKGNQFTAFFIETGTSMGISTKAANIYSGTVTATGLKDITFGYIFIEKGVDPNHDLMDVGKVRIFKDGDRMSDPTLWSARLTSPRTGEGGHAEGSITAR